MAELEVKASGKRKERLDDVIKNRKTVLDRYKELQSTSQQRREKLEQAKRLQLFQRDASGLEAWVADKTRIASDESYKDRRNLQGKIQKHQSFEAEIAAHNNSIIELKNKGRKMIDDKHFAAETIKKRLEEIAMAWDNLLHVSGDKRQKLFDSQKREDFVREADEVSAWITDKVAVASSEEAGKDLEHVELLLKKFDEFFKDVQGNEGRIKSTKQMAQKLLGEGHPNSELIILKQKLVNELWEELQQLVLERRKKLKGAHEIQTFNRTVEETAAWMNEKATTAQLDDYGRDLASVQGLLRKHEGLERDLDALETKVQELGEESEKLKMLHPESTDQIAAKQAEISMLWETLKHKASKRGSKLEDSQKFQKFLADNRELVSWVNDMTRVIEATELGRDLSGAESLLQSHKERKGEIDAHEDSFKATMQFGQSLISFGHFASEEIKDKLTHIAGKKSDLLSLWEKRKKEFEECHGYVTFIRDIEQMENWIAKQESIMSGEKEGDSLESAEGLLKKHEDFQKSLTAQEEKFKALNELADVMIASEHYASTDIAGRRKAILASQKKLLELADKRQSKLQDSCQLQQFLRDVEEINIWINDKKKIASDEGYRDPSNLEAKMQQHHAFDGELQANRHRMETVVEAGQQLVSEKHFAADKIQKAYQGMQDMWSELEALSSDKGQKLQQANDQQQFDRAVKDMEIWLDEMDMQLSTEELGKDLAGVKKLQKKMLLLETDIAVHKDQFDTLSSQADQLIDGDHFDSVAIKTKQEALMFRYEGLHKPLLVQKQRLEASLQLQQFLRDVDDEEAWIKDRESLAKLSNKGTDLISVQSLQKKHNTLMTEITNHEGRINAVVKESKKMRSVGHYGDKEILTKITELQQHWQEVKDSAEARKQLLADSYEAQQYLADALEAELRMKDLDPVVRSSDYGKDEDMAEALMKKHEAVLNEVEGFGGTITSLAERSMKCSAKDSQQTPSEDSAEKSTAKAVFNYKPQSQREIPLKKGEVVTVVNATNKEWWKVSTSSGSTGFVPANHLKSLPTSTSNKQAMNILRKQSFTMSVEYSAQESVTDRQEAIKRKYDTLLHLAKERKQRLEEAKDRFAQSSQINELQHWINDKLSFVTSEEAGRDLEHVLTLKKKFEVFQKELPNIDSKLASINTVAEKMVNEGHNEAEEIKLEMEDLNQQWDSLTQSTSTRKQQLDGAYNVQTFNRAADEAKQWMNEKSTTLQSDDYGRDLGSVQALQRKHEGFETDLYAIEEKVKSLSVEAGAICRTQPQSIKIVKSKEKEVIETWNSLKGKAEARSKKLTDSHDLQKFFSDYRDLMAWVSSVQALVSSQEVASDVGSAETLLTRHKELKNEIEAKKPGIQTFISFGKQLLSQGHYAASSIQESVDALSTEVPSLDKAWTTRKRHLDQCLEQQLFNRDCEQAERWMGKKEAFLASEEMAFSKSLDSVEVLIKKHKDFDKSLQGQEGKIADIQKFADRLFQAKHYAAVEIAERRASVLARWAKLKESLGNWRSRLGQSQSFQQFKREADEIDAWLSEKMSTATDESYRDPTNLSAKLKKHEAFEAEVQANKDRVYNLIETGKEMIESQKCPGLEKDVEAQICSLEEQWAALNTHSSEKTQKLTEATQEQHFNEATKEIEYWLQDMETKLTTEELGHDITSVDSLLKRQQLQEGDIKAHEGRIKDLKIQAQKFVEAEHFDAKSIKAKEELIDSRYAKLQDLASSRKVKLQDSMTLQHFYSNIHEEEAWIKEKNLLVSSTDYGKDLFGVRKHRKNHQHFEKELERHDQAVKVLLSRGDELALSDHYAHKQIRTKCEQLQKQWQELTTISSLREKKLEESLAFQEFCASINEEESWLTEKITVQQSEDFGDSLGAVQNLMRKHETFETDLASHKKNIQEIEKIGKNLIEENNYQDNKIRQRLVHMEQKYKDLETATEKRKSNILISEECLKFNWEADIADSWIKSKYGQLHVEEHGRDILTVQRMLTKHETLKNALVVYQKETIDRLIEKKERLLGSSHAQSRSIQQKHDDLMRKWEKLQKDSEIHQSRLQRSLEQFKNVDELFLDFAKRSSRFLTNLKNIEEDLIDPVKCNTLEELQSIKSVNTQLQQAITQAKADLKHIGAIDRKLKTYNTSNDNPYTWVTLDTLDESIQNVVKLMKERESETVTEQSRQMENDDRRKMFAKQANLFHAWLSETRTALTDSAGTLESQLESVQRKAQEIEDYRDKLRVIEESGARIEEALIFDNKYTEHTPVSLGQQWDQLRQMVMRIQHNIEQQIQARNITGVTEEQLREFSSNFKHFDKNQSGKLEYGEFKACLRSLGYELSGTEQGQTDVEFERILEKVDPNRLGSITFEDYMSFMISKESDNVQSITEIEESFRAIVADREQPYVTREELSQALSSEQFEYCIKKMKLYKDSTGNTIRNVYDYKQFAQNLY